MELLLPLLSGFVLAVLAPGLHRLVGDRAGYVAALLPLGGVLYFGQWIGTLDENAVAVEYQWVPQLNLALSLYLDGLSLLFVMLIAGVGALVAVYSRGYMAGHPHAGAFYLYLFSFMASMLGLVMAGNVLTLYVFWELTTLTSFMLIGFEHESEAARRAAVQSLLTTALGGLAMLAGLILLGLVGGSFELRELFSQGSTVREHELYPAILALILIGACTKSAQFPFHYWLPNAMQAPTPVSAYLHSATMVKAGVYLLARLHPVLGETNEWHTAVTTLGAITMFVGAYMAFFQHELKAVLAYLTVNVLGTLVMLLGIGTELAAKAALVYLLAHAMYKGSLFLTAGVVSHQTHTLDIRKLGGLWRPMPATFAIAVLAALSMAGILPLFGFIAKELYLEAVWKAPFGSMLLTAVSVLASAFLVAGAGIVALRPFLGAPGPRAAEAHEAKLSLLLSPLLLAAAGVALGWFPQRWAGPLIEPALANVMGKPVSVKLELWHGVSPPLWLSLAALAAGMVLYGLREKWLRLPAAALKPEAVAPWGPEAWYARLLTGLQIIAQWQTRMLQSGYLRRYVFILLITTAALVGIVFVNFGIGRLRMSYMGVRFYEGVVVAVILGGAWTAVRSTNRYKAIVSLGVVGFSVSWIYAIFGAPDLAMTQIAIEALTVLLFVLAFRGLPQFSNISSTATRIRDAILAATVGGLMTLLLFIVAGVSGHVPISTYFAEHSYELGHGRNVVNVILVDFRALDTMGEVTVLATAAVGVFALIRLVITKRGSSCSR